jgi:hypothetical protein
MHTAPDAPGFRRRFRITPTPGSVCSEVEDDFHRMRVTIEHDGVVARTVKATLLRAPWSTCPEAVQKCEQTFTGVALREFPARRDKAVNCTHLYDLALLAAAHAFEDAVLVYDVSVSDPVNGRRHARLWRNAEPIFEWWDQDYRIVEPPALAGRQLLDLRSWIDALEPPQQEAARILQSASLIAHGRIIPLEKQSDASRMPPSCYTFQPQQAARAQRTGKSRDFSGGSILPLELSEETT